MLFMRGRSRSGLVDTGSTSEHGMAGKRLSHLVGAYVWCAGNVRVPCATRVQYAFQRAWQRLPKVSGDHTLCRYVSPGNSMCVSKMQHRNSDSETRITRVLFQINNLDTGISVAL